MARGTVSIKVYQNSLVGDDHDVDIETLFDSDDDSQGFPGLC